MNLKPIKGQHHVSAITADAKENVRFYTDVLGMRLVKKTVNQDDTSVYHLFYADERGNPGTDLTFFEIPFAGTTYRGTNSISTTSLRVPSNQALQYWVHRFDDYHVAHEGIQAEGKRQSIRFEDFEGQRLMLVSDEENTGVAGGKPWDQSPVPADVAIYGLGPVRLTISNADVTARVLTEILGFRYERTVEESEKMVDVYATGEGGTGAEIYLLQDAETSKERPGRGSVHHVALRVESEEELDKWVERITSYGLPNSGFVERYYFKSLYFREPNGVLIELATDGPGFEGDESFEHLGESLALPPYLEGKRAEIEAKIKPLNTKS
ncbi:ring-cleaving dioxygenase [Shouchella shacheensis]|uniref:ring-cleaving dioxygenase n=1 Tax=Shouchella shacheensis TaxID=1649580 RepID=UPI00073FF1E4|nr:ring-cleaving dioxygenase [Shouchella shacheensis]